MAQWALRVIYRRKASRSLAALRGQTHSTARPSCLLVPLSGKTSSARPSGPSRTNTLRRKASCPLVLLSGKTSSARPSRNIPPQGFAFLSGPSRTNTLRCMASCPLVLLSGKTSSARPSRSFVAQWALRVIYRRKASRSFAALRGQTHSAARPSCLLVLLSGKTSSARPSRSLAALRGQTHSAAWLRVP